MNKLTCTVEELLLVYVFELFLLEKLQDFGSFESKETNKNEVIINLKSVVFPQKVQNMLWFPSFCIAFILRSYLIYPHRIVIKANCFQQIL